MSIRKNWRTTLLVLLITVTFTSVIGGTMAWFTDTVESSSNVIAAGTLDIDMLVKKGDQYISLEEYPNTQLFGGILWEPGYTAVEYVTIQNKGSLALDYQLNVVPGSDEVKASDGTSLASAIEVYMAFGDTEVTTRDAINDTTKFWYCGTLDELIANEKGFTYGRMLPAVEGEDDAILEPGKVQGSVTCTIVLHMDEDAGNEYQGLTLGSVSLQLMAKQAPVEEDAFDEKYDENAIWPSFESNDYPKANVRLLDPVLDADIYPDGIDDIWYPVTSEGKQTMDCAYLFQATETEAVAAAGPYADWHADFVVYANADVPADSIALIGNYSTYGWIGLVNDDNTVTEGTKIRLLQSADYYVSYEEVCAFQNFYCGASENVDGALDGITLTVELRLYEATGNGAAAETGEYITIGTFNYTFN